MRLGREADLVVVAPATADLLARAAHGLADDLLTTTLLTARCPVRAGARDAHRDVGAPRHPAPTSRRCASAASSCSTRPSAGSPAPTPAPAGCPSPRRSSPPAAARSWPRAPAARPGRPARRRLRRRHPRAARPGALPRQPLLRAAGLRPGRAAAARGARVTLVAANVDAARPAGVDVVRVGTAARAARRRARGRRRAPTPSSWPPRSPTSGPADPARHQDQEGRDRAAPASRWSRNPDMLAELVARPRGAAGQVRRRFRRRDRRRRAAACSTHGRAKLARKGCDLLVVNEVGGGARVRRRRQRRDRPRRRRRPSAPVPPGPQGRRGRRRLGRRRAPAGAAPQAAPDAGCRARTDLSPRSPLHADCEESRVPCACSPPSRSPRATPTRSATRSPTRSSTRCSRRTPRSRVAVETMVTTGLVHVAGEVTTERLRRHPADRARARSWASATTRPRRASTATRAASRSRSARSRRDIAQGVDNAYEDRARRRRRRPAGRAGRRRPGPDVRLRLRRDPRADAAADLRWRTGSPQRLTEVRKDGDRALPAPGRQDPGHHRVRRRPRRSALDTVVVSTPARRRHRPRADAHARRRRARRRAGARRARTSTPTTTGCW